MIYLLLLACGILGSLADDSLRLFSEGNRQFTADVYKQLLKSNSGNFVVCPLSVDIVMALVHAGAKGPTAQQLSAGLHLPENPEEVQKIFSQIAPSLKGNNQYNLSSANKVYVKEGFQISDHFKGVATKTFDAEIQNIDFNQKTAAVNEMNKWVEDKTHDKIKNLISPRDIDENTRAVLINAMYFHGKWVHEFEKYDTRKRPFYINANDHVEIDMMETTAQFNYYESPELKARFLEMFYQGDDISMTFILPDDKEGLAALEARINELLVVPKYSRETVRVVVPKFKIESTIQFKPILQDLGIKDAFEDNADFSGIGAKQEPLKISKVIQKAFIEVEEQGTTAAAATAVIGALAISANVNWRPPKVFHADHPFLYSIRSKQLEAVLFVGRFAASNN